MAAILLAIIGGLDSGKLEVIAIIKNMHGHSKVGHLKTSVLLKEPLRIGNYNVVVCDDIKFIDDFNILKKKGFITAKIVKHLSKPCLYETELIPRESFDFYIENNSSYCDFVYVVSEMFMDIEEKNI